jgi:drug/metabolite transporter (DMT)-like permease
LNSFHSRSLSPCHQLKHTADYFLWFCSFDLTATLISGIGLLWVDASLSQMLRGGTVFFAALASKLIVKQRFSRRQVLGLVTVVAGLALVSYCFVVARETC